MTQALKTIFQEFSNAVTMYCSHSDVSVIHLGGQRGSHVKQHVVFEVLTIGLYAASYWDHESCTHDELCMGSESGMI